MSKRDIAIAKHLADEGKAFSEQLRDDIQEFFDDTDATYFAVAAAISLTWTKHAKYDADFVDYASKFIDGTVAKDPQIALDYSLRFGSESLDEALKNYRIFYKHTKPLMPDFYSCDMDRINRLQQRMLGKLDELRKSGQVQSIGPWLFTGPFKIILSNQDRFWDDSGINTITLPTGLEVNKGICKLKDEGYHFVKDFDTSWLEEGYSSIIDNFATYHLVHSHLAKIGALVDAPAIHINSALYLYGRNEL